MNNKCRTCLKTCVDKKQIFLEKCSNGKTYRDVLMECTSIKVSKTDQLTPYICDLCASRLELYTRLQKRDDRFMELCIKSEAALKNHPSKQLINLPKKPRMLRVVLVQQNTAKENIQINTTQQDPVNKNKINRVVLNSIRKIVKVKVVRRDHIKNLDKLNLLGVQNKNIKENTEVNMDPNTLKVDIKEEIDVVSVSDEDGPEDHKDVSLTEKSKPYVCQVCSKVFTRKNYLTKHETIHLEVMPFKCTECSEGFRFRWKLVDHMKNHDSKNKFQCDTCGRSFTFWTNYIKHKKSHEKIRKCGMCDKLINGTVALVKHYKENHTCDICHSKFTKKEMLDRHKLIHIKSILFACEICDRGFYVKSALTKHIKENHLTEGQYQCKYCDKMLLTKYGLEVHIMIKHIGRKPFPCEKCEKSYLTQAELENHSTNKHPDASKPIIRSTDFQCTECNKIFSDRINLAEHFGKYHSVNRNFECPLCCSIFYSKCLLGKHIRAWHGN